MKKLLYPILLLLFTACNSGGTDEIVYKPLEREPNPKELIAEVINDELMLGHTVDAHYYNSHILVKSVVDNTHLQFFDVETGEHVASGGRIGKSRTELNQHDFFMHAVGSKVNVQTQGEYLAKVYDIDRILKGNDDGFIDGVTSKTLKFSSMAMPLDNERTLISSNDIEKGRLQIINKDTTLFSYNDLPNLIEDEKHNSVIWEMGTKGAFKPDMSKMVYLPGGYGSIMEIIDIKEDRLERVVLNTYIKPNFDYQEIDFGEGRIAISMGPGENGIIGFRDIFSTDKFIYTIYSEELEKTEDAPNPELVIFDWKGRYVKEYKLDKNLLHIAVDEKSSIVYGIARDEDGILSLVSYDL